MDVIAFLKKDQRWIAIALIIACAVGFILTTIYAFNTTYGDVITIENKYVKGDKFVIADKASDKIYYATEDVYNTIEIGKIYQVKIRSPPTGTEYINAACLYEECVAPYLTPRS